MLCDYEASIGIEVHVELKTRTKAFCLCSAEYGGTPNTKCCPVCLGMPGTLPVLNKYAFELAVTACISTGCEVSHCSHFDRKNYFYPDLPKGYQITQNDTPVGRNGFIEIVCGDKKKKIGITRIHFEEDAAKLIHKSEEDAVFIDYNRCGIPLIEIVSEPDIKNSDEAKAYLTELRRILIFSGVSDCKMNEGSMRCDVNVSVKRKGETKLGTRCEIKNLNSINFAARAIEAEIKRQAELIDSGKIVNMETRKYFDNLGITEKMRDKEKAIEYRFIREPDIPDILLQEQDIERLKMKLGMPPGERIKMYISKFSLSRQEAQLICTHPNYADYYETAASTSKSPKVTASLFISEILPNIINFKPDIPPEYLAQTANIFSDGKLSSTNTKRLLKLIRTERKNPYELMKIHSLEKITDKSVILAMIEEIKHRNPAVFEDIINGKIQAKKVIVGEIMKISKGNADPVMVSKEVDLYFK